MGFIFLRSCFMGFMFLWFWLWVHLIFVVLVVGSFDFLRSRNRLSLSLRLGSLEQIQEEGRWWFRENGARSRPSSRPKWSSISASAQSIDDCEIPLPLSFLINNGGSWFG
ncbi:hypothetical protein SO802_014260 [Lithocarpus litseifolius]|uniref:Uncharacterized protein n=1 Tax=Lithocarpus litseifolius TaxID=425828 RepID=A0AAW2CQZ8_9ROSI